MRGATVVEGEPKMLLARALYDNCPDCSDELAFCRGDILTILEQDVLGSEGWWRCLLHGKQGLAPANRLQVLSGAPADRLCLPFLRGLEDALTSSKEISQVPALFSPPPPSPVYEQMKSWVEGPPPPMVQAYRLPGAPASARLVCETMLSFPNQAVFSIATSAQAASPALYDTPLKSRSPWALKEPGQQQLYDVPASPRKAALGPPAGRPSGQSEPAAPAAAFGKPCCRTLPNPQKSEWVYDTPVTPQKADVRNAAISSFVEESGPPALPGQAASFHSPPNGIARSLSPHLCKAMPVQKKLSLPEIPAHHGPAPREATRSGEGAGYKVPSSFLIPRVEQQNTKPNIYDIPKAVPRVPQDAEGLEKKAGAPENAGDRSSSWPPKKATWLCAEPDRLSINSSDSRVSVVSSCSSASTDSSSSSFSEELAREPSLDQDLARGMVTALQHKVASSVEGLMLFVSRKWRLRDCLEANIDAIRQAAGRIEGALREFLDFAHGVCGAAGHLTDSHLQARIRNQLQTVSNSYQVLLESKGSLDSCHWSLEALVTDRVQSSPDALERFVLVARTVPEDVKRFAAIVIANGRLLFKQNSEKQGTGRWTPNAECKLAKRTLAPQRETGSLQSSAPYTPPREGDHSPELLKKNWTGHCEKKLPNLEEEVKPILEQRLDENKHLETQNSRYPAPRHSGRLDPESKVRLSEHCRLYFGALFKAMGAFHSSLGHSQPPEAFITQSKLVITIGQKLVDTLCKETQDRDVRNEILRGSSRLCGLLKSLALATKQAVLEHPSPAALGRLRAEAKRLEQHARQFRGMLE